MRQPWDDVGKLLIPRMEGGDLLDQGIAELLAPKAEQLVNWLQLGCLMGIKNLP